MPDGWNQVFGLERYRATEGLFDVKAALTSEASPAPSPGQSLPATIQASLSQVDVDIRPHLLAHVVVTGGASLTQGFCERLNQELMALYPGPRVRIAAPGNVYERRFASWIGGSILASLGTFHQVSFLWMGFAMGMLMVGFVRCGFRRRSMRSMGRGLWRRGVSDCAPVRCAARVLQLW